MNAVVLGAGTVGTSIAELLCRQRHNVTVVDSDPAHTRRMKEELDARVIAGSASESSVLFQAGVAGADLCLAVTGSDEVNLVAASMAKSMGSRRTVARVYAPIFRDLSTFDYQRHFHIDRLLSLEHLSAMELARSIRHPGSITLENFARGEIEVREIEVSSKSSLIGKPLRELKLPKDVRIGSILRDDEHRIASADDALAPQDHLTLIGTREAIDDVRDRFQRDPQSKQSVVIAGGGETGYHLARLLEERQFTVVLMEADRERCEFLASHLNSTTVVNCDATRRSTLEEERVGSADVFVVCTGDDENNIMAGVEAREIGAETIMAIVGRPDYANVVGKLGIDHAVSPRKVMARQILGFLNTGPVVSRSGLFGGEIDVMEIEVLPTAPVTERALASLPLPPQCLIVAVMRESFVTVPGADDRLQAGDSVVALVDHAAADAMLQLFLTNDRGA